MRCITSTLLLLLPLAACVAATTPSSSGTAHTTANASEISAELSSVFSHTSASTPTSIASTAAITNARSSATSSNSPLVFLAETNESLCPSRTVNYITHTLPQQCLRTSRSVLGNATLVEGRDGNSTSTLSQTLSARGDDDVPDGAAAGSATRASVVGLTDSPEDASKTQAGQTASPLGLEDEHDSPLDKSKFLSFEEWKKLNLEKVGQSPENVGQGRQQGGEGRQRPINNALDTLGEEGEIELDFGGFGDSSSRITPGTPSETAKLADSANAEESAHASPARHRSKDAGKTCKERFNYASFDCAATVLKTNSRCKSSSSVLVENKDSYMLNECSSDNKFIIIELCDDILVDTVVVANFEFFSSMFRTFRVSVSDRYPVKADRWKDLGTFEARNTRDIQAFLVENPLIWARYLRIEFLAHYGSEFYCPVSLVRVHGTTMMEEFRHQEDIARGEEDDGVELVPEVEPVAPVQVEASSSTLTETASSITVLAKEKESSTVTEEVTSTPVLVSEVNQDASTEVSSDIDTSCNGTLASPTTTLAEQPASGSSTVIGSPGSSKDTTSVFQGSTKLSTTSTDILVRKTDESSTESQSTSRIETEEAAQTRSMAPAASEPTVVPSVSILISPNTVNPSASRPSTNSTDGTQKTGENQNGTTTATTINSQSAKVAGSETLRAPPPPPQPSTQDSFFKQTNKRLNMLETNSSLNIQYIEEQSRILRDAFVQTEKRQLTKTENFLRHLNDTVMAELKGFRTQYDQLWQSTVIELEESRARSHKEMMAFSSRLTMLADELVWAKRMNVVQSILLLASLGLFVFASKGRDYMDMPIMQQALRRSQSVLRFGGQGRFDSPSPPGSPDSTRASSPEFRRSLVNMNRPSTSSERIERQDSHHSDDVSFSSPPIEGTNRSDNIPNPTTPTSKPSGNPGLHFEPPTPEPSIDGDGLSIRGRSASPTLSPEEAAEAVARGAHSGPATPSGTRENQPLDWADGGINDGVESKLEAIGAKVLHLKRHDTLHAASAVRAGSPLRYSTLSELGGQDIIEEDIEEDNIVPSIENARNLNSGELNHEHEAVPSYVLMGDGTGDNVQDHNSPITREV